MARIYDWLNDPQRNPKLIGARLNKELDNVSQGVSVVAYGADPTGVADSTSAFNAALAASNYVIFPPGKFKFNSAITYNIPSGIKSITIAGSGQDVTILYWPNSSGGLTLNYAGADSSAHIRDLSFTTGTTNGGTALNLQNSASNANPAVTAISDIYRVTFRGDDDYSATDYWSTAVNVGNVSNIQFETVTVNGAATPNGNGIVLLGLPGSSTYGVAYNIAKSTFNNLAAGIIYSSFIQGVTIDQSNFTSNDGTSRGIVVPAAQTGTLAQLAVTNSQFNVPTNAIEFGTTIGDVLLANNLVISRTNSNAFNFSGGNNTNFTITGNVLTSSSVTGTNGIVIGGSMSLVTISANVILGFTTGVWLQANAANVTVTGNTLNSNTTALLNQSNATSNFIANNPNYNPIGVTAATTMGASPFTYTAGSSSETHYVKQAATNTATITQGGQQTQALINANTYYTIELGPNESYITTWVTTAPTYTKFVH